MGFESDSDCYRFVYVLRFPLIIPPYRIHLYYLAAFDHSVILHASYTLDPGSLYLAFGGENCENV